MKVIGLERKVRGLDRENLESFKSRGNLESMASKQKSDSRVSLET